MTHLSSKKFSVLFFSSLVLGVATTASAASGASTQPNGEAPSSSAANTDGTAATPGSNGGEQPSEQARVNASGAASTQVSPPPSNSSAIPVSIAALGSFGPTSDFLLGGVGLRAGVHLEGVARLYIGAIANYFFGLKDVQPDQLGEKGSSTQRHFMSAGAEGGVEFSPWRAVTLRPYLGVGLGRATQEDCGGSGSCKTKSTYPLTITPAILGLYDVSSALFVGADIRYLIASGNNDVKGPVLSATVGLRF